MTFGKNIDRDNEELHVFPVVVENELFNRAQEKSMGRLSMIELPKAKKIYLKGC